MLSDGSMKWMVWFVSLDWLVCHVSMNFVFLSVFSMGWMIYGVSMSCMQCFDDLGDLGCFHFHGLGGLVVLV